MSDYESSQILGAWGISGNDLPPVIMCCGVKAISLSHLARFLNLSYEALLARRGKIKIGPKDYFETSNGLSGIGNPRMIFTKSGTQNILNSGHKKPNRRATELIIDLIFNQEPIYFISEGNLKQGKTKSTGTAGRRTRGTASEFTKLRKLRQLELKRNTKKAEQPPAKAERAERD